MSEINISAYSVQMRLVIRNIQRSDLGGYKCISKNSIGDAEGNIRLYGKNNIYNQSRNVEKIYNNANKIKKNTNNATTWLTIGII